MIDENKDSIKNLITFFIKNTQHCDNEKLAKLLYCLDFYHYREAGTSFTDLEYTAYSRMPYPDKLGDKIYSHANSKLDDRFFSRRVFRILENILSMFKDLKAEEMGKDYDIFNSWYDTFKKHGVSVIDYNLALNESSPIREWIEEEEWERREIKRLLG